jgi:hypothetical protein
MAFSLNIFRLISETNYGFGLLERDTAVIQYDHSDLHNPPIDYAPFSPLKLVLVVLFVPMLALCETL